jgi:diguanylate cyclase (GGDEF)-like protein/PAS domain S-box-containing protein
MVAMTLRVLMVEDSPDDCRLVLHELRRSGRDVHYTRVQTAQALRAELDRGGWDIVISDFELPSFSGRDALAMVRGHPSALPFVLVTGAAGEDIAVDALKAGASDYVMKGNLARLGPAVERALREHAAALEQAEMRRALHRSEADYLDLIEHAADGMFVCDRQGRYLNVNPRLCDMLGYSREELLALGAGSTVPPLPADKAPAEPGGERHIRFERLVQRKDGSTFPADISARVSHTGKVQCVVRDASERHEAEQRVARLNRLYAVLSSINGMMVRVRSRDELFREACRIAVEEGGFSIAWIGMVDEQLRLVPVAWSGPAKRHLDLIRDHLHLNNPEHGILSARAIAGRRVVYSNAVESDERVVSGGHLAALGTQSLAVLPLEVGGQPIGNFALYAAEKGFFDDEELRLLRNMSANINFTLDHLEKLERLDYLAYYDELTGLPNRHLFLERLAASLRVAGESGGRVVVGILDLHGFKTINDTFGRQAGDELLRQIARRSADGAPVRDSRFARVGPDQFAVLAPLKGPEQEFVVQLESAFEHYFSPLFKVNNTELHLSGRAGLAIFPQDGADAETVFRNAEAAVKKAKAAGERYLFYTREMTHRVAEKVMLASKLRQAQESGAFLLHYQPKVDLKTRAVTGVEALLRWTDPDTGQAVPPVEFIPILEETGLIVDVGAWALGQAVRDFRAWQEQGLAAPRVAVNVSPVQLRRRDFVKSVREAVAQGAAQSGAVQSGAVHAAAAQPGLDLEITESLLMEDVPGNIEKLREVKALGIAVAVDDFGTGYSSLGYLARLPVAILKIDRSFVSTMLGDANTMTLVSTIITLAHSLGLKVVAEGVEEEAQAQALLGLGCDQMQGYLISRPVPAAALAARLASAGRDGERLCATMKAVPT